ncbi:hypothetical protein WDU94_009198 [Cyamophila willieti]
MSSYYQHDANWTWSPNNIPSQTEVSESGKLVVFHPKWSKGTPGVRGTMQLNHGRHYWEINSNRRTTGTSVQFGVGTMKARIHHDKFVDLLGNDENSWALSHRGMIFHGGVAYKYTDSLMECDRRLRIGIEFDGIAGTLAFYKDGEYLGIAFRGLQLVKEPLYPMVSSTALKTRMMLELTRQDYVGLVELCRASIVTNMSKAVIDKVYLPTSVREYIEQAMERVKITPFDRCRYYTLNFE